LSVLHRGALPGHRSIGISRSLCLFVLCALAGLAQAHAAEHCGYAIAEALPHPPRLVPAGRNLWRVPAAEGESSPSNGGVVTQLVLVRDGARLWLLGSGPTPTFGAALACRVAHELGQAVTDVVNTRAHPELAMGNSAFPGARVWALPDVADAMAAQCGTCMERLRAQLGPAGASLDPALIRVPTQHVGGKGATRGALGPFRWRAVPRAPGVRTLVLQPRGQALLVAQGLVWVGGIPNLRETDSATLLASLRRLRAMAALAQVIGEQGETGGIGDIDSHIAYLGALREAVRRHVERGDDEAAALASITLPAFATRAGYAAFHPLNGQRVWREFEQALFR
jgi:hypothetical protein